MTSLSPVTEVAAGLPATRRSPLKLAAVPDHRILVIDDNPSIHEDFRKVLSPKRDSALEEAEASIFGAVAGEQTVGFVVDSALQGREGLDMVEAALAAQRPYALAFVDVRMPPGWDGIETICRLWNVDPNLQIVICTAYSDYSWEQIIERVGNNDRLLILKKPFDNIEVLQLAHALCKKCHLARAVQQRLCTLDGLVAERTAQIRAQEQRWRMLFDCSPDAVVVVENRDGLPGRFIEVNDVMCKRLGYTREELLRLSPMEINAPESIPKIPAAGQRLAREAVHLTKAGIRIPVEVNVQSIDLDGRPAFCAVVRDLTERKRAERALDQAQEQLRQSQKLEAIGQLAGGVAHDFNNLLAVIRGNTDLVMIKMPGLPQDVADFLQQIAAASDRAANLTRQLLAFSRKQIMQANALDLNTVVGNLARMLKRIIGEDIHMKCESYLPLPAIRADAGMLEQVLVNLAVNARDAMPRGGTLSISTGLVQLDAITAKTHSEARPGPYVTLTVTDTGVGIAPEHLPHIFEPFFTTKDVGKGTGLGWSTVYGIVRQHQGWIEVHSKSGEGATFRIYLPAMPAPCTGAVSTEKPASLQGGSENILLVEDDDAVRLLTRRVLEQHGYNVLEAASGAKALVLVHQERPKIDLLLTDVVMPDNLTGRELADELHKDSPELKVLFTSGYSKDAISRDCLNGTLRNSRFVAKPCPPGDLLKAVRDLLDKRA